jgi:hypothetical protein
MAKTYLHQRPDFIGSKEYWEHKEKRFPKIDLEVTISQNEAFLLSDPTLRKRFAERYKNTEALYYKGQPSFEQILDTIRNHIEKL